MMVLVVGLALLAIVAAVVITAATARRQGDEPAATVSRSRPRDPWLVDAGEAVQSGLLLLRDLDPVVADTEASERSTAAVDDAIRQLDQLTSHLAALTTTAPTEMDGRVCRNASVRVRALSDSLGGRSSDPSVFLKRTSVQQPEVLHRRADCELALHDLAEHVHLL